MRRDILTKLTLFYLEWLTSSSSFFFCPDSFTSWGKSDYNFVFQYSFVAVKEIPLTTKSSVSSAWLSLCQMPSFRSFGLCSFLLLSFIHFECLSVLVFSLLLDVRVFLVLGSVRLDLLSIPSFDVQRTDHLVTVHLMPAKDYFTESILPQEWQRYWRGKKREMRTKDAGRERHLSL